jgi:hypothetical protein
LIDVRRGLEKLLDEVTPYYKAKIESLPPQQRKILDHIARVSARTGSGLTPTEIAAETRLPVNQVTSQLKRLSGLGYVRAANVRARSSWYSLAEPLYAIWHQMRFGRESRERMAWLVEFLKAWYSSREMLDETDRLTKQFEDLMRLGEKVLAVETLDYIQYFADAMVERFRGGATDRLVNACLDAGDMDRVRGMVSRDGLTQLCTDTLERLTDSGLITPGQLSAFRDRSLQLATRLQQNPEPEAVLETLDPRNVPLHENPHLWVLRANALHRVGRDDEALEDLEMGARFVSETLPEALLKAEVLFKLRRFRDVIGVLSRFGSDPGAPFLLAASATMLGDFDRATAVCETVLARRDDPVLREFLEELPVWRNRFREPLSHFGFLVFMGAFADARTIWVEKCQGTLRAADLNALLRILINGGNRCFIRTLIRDLRLEDQLLPLVVAMDYLETGDRSPLEKLSAEVRPIAEEIVAELQKKLPTVAERSMHTTHA